MPDSSQAGFTVVLDRYFSRESLELEPASVFAVGTDGTISYVNQAWDRFAADNGGDAVNACALQVGAHYLDAIAAELQPFYRDLLARAPAPGKSLHPISHEYECSSARFFRKFLMQVYALPNAEGHLIVNSMALERPHDVLERKPAPPDRGVYSDAHGLIHQCSHCRRVRQASESARWDWVPDFVERQPAETSHGICPACFNYYYPITRD